MTNIRSKTKSLIFRRILISIVVIGFGLSIFAIMTARTSTPAFTDSNGSVLPNSIAEEQQILIGGIEQYVLLRGRNRSAPLLVYVHGGPGASATPFLRAFNANLENDFVVVYWDQRGAAQNFDPNLDTASLTIERMTADLGELIDILLDEFDHTEVLLVGHSWGTILALEHVGNRPETVAAYIAISQTTNQYESDTLGYEWALSQADISGNDNAFSVLDALGPPPYDIEEFNTQRRFVNLLGGGLVEAQSDLDLIRIALATPEFAWPNVLPWVRSASQSSRALWTEQQSYDAFSLHTSLDVPIYMILGRHDKIISPSLGEKYLAQVDAPEKELFWFEQSAHSPHFEEPEKFNEIILQIAKKSSLLSE